MNSIKFSSFFGFHRKGYICYASSFNEFISCAVHCLQKYLQSTTVRVEEMRVKRRDAERWMSHRMLPEDLRQRIRRYEHYKWQENRGVEEEALIHNLPKDLRRDIKRHLCLALLKKVGIILSYIFNPVFMKRFLGTLNL